MHKMFIRRKKWCGFSVIESSIHNQSELRKKEMKETMLKMSLQKWREIRTSQKLKIIVLVVLVKASMLERVYGMERMATKIIRTDTYANTSYNNIDDQESTKTRTEELVVTLDVVQKIAEIPPVTCVSYTRLKSIILTKGKLCTPQPLQWQAVVYLHQAIHDWWRHRQVVGS